MFPKTSQMRCFKLELLILPMLTLTMLCSKTTLMIILSTLALVSVLFFVDYLFHYYFSLFFVGVEKFCESLIDPRGGIVELEKLSQENPALYQLKLANLRATFSVFPGEACLYYK